MTGQDGRRIGDPRPDALPIHMELCEMMIRDMASGRLVDGQKLPPEREMAAFHGTTVRTLRKALKLLEEKGLLDRRHGSGNYVRAGQPVESVYSMFRLERIDGGGLPSADTLSVDWLDKPSNLPAFGTSEHATRFRRLRYLGRDVVALEEIWLDGGAGRIAQDKVQDSLYLTYRTALKLLISRAEDRVGLGMVPEWAPSAFGLPQGTATVEVERLSWARAAEAVEFSRTWIDTQRARYVQRLI